jgi:hypothetical protein
MTLELSFGAGQGVHGFCISLGWRWLVGIGDGGAIAAHVYRVHYGESAADAEGKSKEKAEDGWPVGTHIGKFTGAWRIAVRARYQIEWILRTRFLALQN